MYAGESLLRTQIIRNYRRIRELEVALVNPGKSREEFFPSFVQRWKFIVTVNQHNFFCTIIIPRERISSSLIAVIIRIVYSKLDTELVMERVINFEEAVVVALTIFHDHKSVILIRKLSHSFVANNIIGHLSTLTRILTVPNNSTCLIESIVVASQKLTPLSTSLAIKESKMNKIKMTRGTILKIIVPQIVIISIYI